MKGTLYLVATPIGNWEDITLRALRVLKEVDVIIYEGKKEGKRLLSHFKIPEKITNTLNEHNEYEITSDIIKYLNSGKNVALISDAGTPVFLDPGHHLVKKALEEKINLVPIPGASSLIPAIVLSGIPIDEFLFYGFLSPKHDKRILELKKLSLESRTIVIMDTPYRLLQVLKDICDILGNEKNICLAYNLTMPNEKIIRGKAIDVYNQAITLKLKGEFVLVIEGNKYKK